MPNSAKELLSIPENSKELCLYVEAALEALLFRFETKNKPFHFCLNTDDEKPFKLIPKKIPPYCTPPARLQGLRGTVVSRFWQKNGAFLCGNDPEVAKRVYLELLIFFEAVDQGFTISENGTPSSALWQKEKVISAQRNKNAHKKEFLLRELCKEIWKQIFDEINKQQKFQLSFEQLQHFETTDPEIAQQGIYMSYNNFYDITTCATKAQTEYPLEIIIHKSSKHLSQAPEAAELVMLVHHNKNDVKALLEQNFELFDFKKRGHHLFVTFANHDDALSAAFLLKQQGFSHSPETTYRVQKISFTDVLKIFKTWFKQQVA